jgi:hypothetical protein
MLSPIRGGESERVSPFRRFCSQSCETAVQKPNANHHFLCEPSKFSIREGFKSHGWNTDQTRMKITMSMVGSVFHLCSIRG